MDNGFAPTKEDALHVLVHTPCCGLAGGVWFFIYWCREREREREAGNGYFIGLSAVTKGDTCTLTIVMKRTSLFIWCLLQ